MKRIRPTESPAFTDLMTALLFSVDWALSVRGVMHAAEHTARLAATSFLRSIGLFPLPSAFRAKACGRLQAVQNSYSAISVSATLYTRSVYSHINIGDSCMICCLYDDLPPHRCWSFTLRRCVRTCVPRPASFGFLLWCGQTRL